MTISNQLTQHAWVDEFPAAITVCDKNGVVLEMNGRSCETFKDDGGAALIGTSLLACHPPAARAALQQLLETGHSNTYTIEKGGRKKLIFQSPWYNEGVYSGFVEVSIPLPDSIPHFNRDLAKAP